VSHITYVWHLTDVWHVTRKSYMLEEQHAEIDQAEPGRSQWVDCMDEERIAHVSEELNAMLMPANERATNWVSEKFK
jgi:hypothetical protein